MGIFKHIKFSEARAKKSRTRGSHGLENSQNGKKKSELKNQDDLADPDPTVASNSNIPISAIEIRRDKRSTSKSVHDKENEPSVYLRPPSNFIKGSAMFAFAQESSKIAASFADQEKTTENSLYCPTNSPKECKVIFPVSCKRDIYVASTEISGKKNEIVLPSYSIAASMLCRKMDGDSTRLGGSPPVGAVNPRRLHRLSDASSDSSPHGLSCVSTFSTLSFSPMSSASNHFLPNSIPEADEEEETDEDESGERVSLEPTILSNGKAGF